MTSQKLCAACGKQPARFGYQTCSNACRGALAARGRTSHGRGHEFAAAQPDFRRKAEPKAEGSWWICDPAEFPTRASEAAKRMNAVRSHYETRVAV